MRILQLHVFSPMGGIETLVPDVSAELSRRGHHVSTLYGHLSGREIAAGPGTAHRWAEARDFGRVSHDLERFVGEVIKEQRIDVALLHVTIDSGLATAIGRLVPCAFFAHNFGIICPAGSRLFRLGETICDLVGVPDHRCLVNAYTRGCNTRRPLELMRRYDRNRSFGDWVRDNAELVCGSSYMAARCLENGFSSERLHRVPIPVHIPLKLKHRSDTGRIGTVVFAGRLSVEKGLHYLIQAMAQVTQPSRLLVAGTGDQERRLGRLCAELGVESRVDFVGYLDRDALTDLYSRADVAVVPSVWPEPFGMSGPEAMAHGVPVVAARVGGIPEWLNDGETGVLVEPKDPIGLAGAIDRLLSDKRLARSMGRHAREVVANRYTVTRHVDHLLTALESATKSRWQREAAIQP